SDVERPKFGLLELLLHTSSASERPLMIPTLKPLKGRRAAPLSQATRCEEESSARGKGVFSCNFPSVCLACDLQVLSRFSVCQVEPRPVTIRGRFTVSFRVIIDLPPKVIRHFGKVGARSRKLKTMSSHHSSVEPDLSCS